ncbi:helix-hairpin-helix domain-containing protein [Embleya sp. NPDC020886]|uniref:helix-hairpin-helix domain-containing protein n=1 Tax=Embleya sp. NPDC020886 TaxID=3363980 RepID=UPI0037AEBE5E
MSERNARADRERIGLVTYGRLVDQDPVEVHERMSAAYGERRGPCLLDTIGSAAGRAEGRAGRPRWHYSPERKRLLIEWK